MTRAVQRRFGRGGSADTVWTRASTVRFANYYREAFLAFGQGRTGAVPDPWLVAVGTRSPVTP